MLERLRVDARHRIGRGGVGAAVRRLLVRRRRAARRAAAEERGPGGRAARSRTRMTYTVTSDYFKTLGLTMVRGREFTAAEEAARRRHAAGDHRRRRSPIACSPTRIRSASCCSSAPTRGTRRLEADADRRRRARREARPVREPRPSRTSTCRRAPATRAHVRLRARGRAAGRATPSSRPCASSCAPSTRTCR